MGQVFCSEPKGPITACLAISLCSSLALWWFLLLGLKKFKPQARGSDTDKHSTDFPVLEDLSGENSGGFRIVESL